MPTISMFRGTLGFFAVTTVLIEVACGAPPPSSEPQIESTGSTSGTPAGTSQAAPTDTDHDDSGVGTTGDASTGDPGATSDEGGSSGGPAVEADCGDGIVEGEEVCDDGASNSDAWSPAEHCNASCTGLAPTCDQSEDTSVTFPRPGIPYPVENQHSTEKAVLGKILFWDEQLSSDDTVACGTCHRPEAGGSDPRSVMARHPGSDGMLGTDDDPHGSPGIARCQIDAGSVVYTEGSDPQVTRRKSPSALDAMFATTLFWDGRATDQFVDPETGEVSIETGGALESQAVGPILSDVEMACEGRTWDDVKTKLAQATPLALARDLPPDVANAVCRYPSYGQLFETAFGDPEITAERIAFAIATYERTLVSDQTPYDQFVDGDADAMTAAESAGLEVFTGAGLCQRCHPVGRFENGSFANLGFFPSSWDTGLLEVTGTATDEGRFRTPTLRNLGLRREGGLLHDGVVTDVRAIIDLYITPPIPPGPESVTDPRMFPLTLTDPQVMDLQEFLENGLTDPRVAAQAYPFDRPRLSSEP